LRLLFSCDAHGSELVWKKFLKLGLRQKADVLFMAGDLTGKTIVPIVKREKDEWFCSWKHAQNTILRSQHEVDKAMDSMRQRGFYPLLTTPGEVESLKKESQKLEEIFVSVMKEGIRRWLTEIIGEVRIPKHVKIFVSPGNDDYWEIDDIINANSRVTNPLGKVVEIGSYKIISCAYVNTTPWATPRECSDDVLEHKLEDLFNEVKGCKNVICNFHAPPHGTNLDIAVKLDKDLKPVLSFGQPVFEHVGSRAVRESLEKHQPTLALHGHIHESYGFVYLGRTLCVNPGSEYEAGILRAYLIDLPEAPGEKPDLIRLEA